MPNKARKAASRQAQLRRRKRRVKSEPTRVFDAGPQESSGMRSAEEASAVLDADPAVETSPPAPTARPARRSRQRAVSEPQSAAVYIHLGAELRRIGLIAGFMVVVLAGLTVALRG